ncbi:peptidylprolyl isomerase [Dokdonella sp.]|uniref:peptidylprolyl isomerase n=1 Tax=Dokdonella sp. TaxID=2291710 RepID=UPI0027B8E0D6|nr:peptidylprolyl isomerase [Dokdonella sp.]
MKQFLLATLAALAAAIHAPAALAQSLTQPVDGIVAVVNDDVILRSELDRQVAQVTTQFANNPAQLPPRDILERQLLDRLILQKLQIARAVDSGIKVSDAQIDQTLVQIAQQNRLDVSQLRGAIESQGMDYGQFRNNVRDQLLVQHLRQQVGQSRAQVSDAEIDSLIKNGHVRTEQLHAAHIVINVPEGATPGQIDEAHAKAEDVVRQIRGGMEFAAAALRYSNAEDALQGGDLGWRNANELPPALVAAADKLQDGEITDPLRGPNGFHIVKLIGKRDAGAQMVTEYKLQHILVKTSELVSSAQAKQRIEAIRNRIVGGEDFAKAAIDSSEETETARLGGDMGWAPAGAFGPVVQQIVDGLKKGEVSLPFEAPPGWHLLKLDDTRQANRAGQMQRSEAKNMIFQRKAEEEYMSFLRQLRSEAYVEIRLPGSEPPKAGSNS